MSRIGKLPVPIPAKVKVEVQGRAVRVEGPKGKLDLTLPRQTRLTVEGSEARVTRQSDNREAKAAHGLVRALLFNMVKGVTEGFSKRLEIHGVGFKAAVENKVVTMNLGYSHQIKYPIPDQVESHRRRQHEGDHRTAPARK